MVTEENSQSLKKIKGNKDDVNKEEKNETIRHQIKSIKDSTIKKLNGDIDLMIDEMMKEIHTNTGSKGPHSYLNNNVEHQTRRTKTGKILDKEYIARNSPLDDLFKAKHIETIYHIAITFLIIYFTNTTISDFRKTGTVDLGFSLMAHGFNNLGSVFVIWVVMTASVFIVCPTFKFWATVRVQMTPKSKMIKVWDHFWIAVFCLYFAFFLAIPAKLTFLCQLKAPSAMVILMEQTRYLMKMYAFVRSNAPRVIAYKPHATDTILHPSFEQYLYFLFIPALVYKDQYPRTKAIRWNVVFWSFLEVFIIIMLHGILFGKVIFPKFENFGKEKMHFVDLCIAIAENSFPAICIYVSGFYLILHCWMNAWAELMRFADRLFYQDWWNSSKFSTFYRFWNVVVHDWLYTYVFQDVSDHIVRGRRNLSVIAVFMLSAVFHEFILSMAFGFFYPVLFTSFIVCSFPLVFIDTSKNKVIGNMLVWWCITFGNGVVYSLYTMEYYARQHCPMTKSPLVDFFVPRSFTCDAIIYDTN